MVNEIPNWFVICLGMGTVFVGLISIIILCKILGALCGSGKADKSEKTESAPAASAASAVIENRQEILAAVTAAAAEEMGTDVSAIRVLSFKKL